MLRDAVVVRVNYVVAMDRLDGVGHGAPNVAYAGVTSMQYVTIPSS